MNIQFTFDGYQLPTISRLCKELGSPTEGHLAEFVWRISNSSALPVGVAQEFLRSAGYVPFKGYPLTHADSEGALCAGPNTGSAPMSACSLLPPAYIDRFAARARTAIAWTDGGSRGNPGPAAYGVLLKDANGRKITELRRFVGVSTNNVAEYEGLLAALVYASQTGHKRLQVYTDSELMVRQIRGIYRVRDAQLSSLFARAIAFIRTFEWFSIDHIPRSQNADADCLVNQTINQAS
jgi:ribonuclease HI